jgi:MFS family permease
MPGGRRLDRAATRRAMRLGFPEGVAYAAMVGFAEMYFVPDALRLGAGPVTVALAVGLPLAVGGVGAALGLRMLARWRQRRSLVVVGAIAQALVLLGLGIAELLERGSPALLVVSACAYHFFAQLVNAPWSSWYGDLVPVRIRGRYFSLRTRAMHLATFSALLVAGGLLVAGPPLGGDGFAFPLLYGLAALARLTSASLIAAAPDFAPDEAEPVPAASIVPSLRRTGDRLALGAGLIFFTVYLAAPFFTPYMLEQLRLDYMQFTLATAASVAGKVFSLQRWGRSVDQYGAVSVYRLAIVLLAIAPVPWLVVEGFAGVLVAQVFGGFAWAAHEVAFFTLLLESTSSQERARAYAMQSATSGAGQLGGSLIGGALLAVLVDPRAVFAVSTGARLLAVVAIGVLVAGALQSARLGRRRLLLRVIGLRPNSGVIHRPMPTPPPDD